MSARSTFARPAAQAVDRNQGDARADAAVRPPDQACRRTRKPWRYSVCSCACTRGRCAHHGTPRRPTK
eukprot:1644041-Lingulodinium_polyedra.AAC.1